MGVMANKGDRVRLNMNGHLKLDNRKVSKHPLRNLLARRQQQADSVEKVGFEFHGSITRLRLKS